MALITIYVLMTAKFIFLTIIIELQTCIYNCLLNISKLLDILTALKIQ